MVDLKILEDMRIKFGDLIFEPDVRKADEIKLVLYEESNIDDEEVLYYMFREVAKNEKDAEIIRKYNLRHDITIIPPIIIGKEYVKTLGHVHVPDAPEIYYVIEGKAHFLMQKVEGLKVLDVYLVEAEAGDSVVIPSGYGHVTINPKDKTLIMGNWICRDVKGDYSMFKKLRGACYYELTEGLVKNKNYEEVPEIRIIKAESREFSYDSIKDIERLAKILKPNF